MPVSKELTPRSFGAASSSLVGNLFSGMNIASAALAVFMQPITREMGWSHAQLGSAISILHVTMSLSTMTVGRLADRLGPRAVLLPLTVLSALLMMSLSLPGDSFAVFFAKCALLGFFTPGTVYYTKLLSDWFFARRGLALGAFGAGTALTTMVTPQVAGLLLMVTGWQNTFVVFGLAILLVAFPVLFALFREPDAAAGPRRSEESAEAPRLTVLQAWRVRAYWLTLGAHFGGIFAFMALSSHGVGILTERGASREVAILGLSMIAGGSLVAQMVTGYLLDRVPSPKVVAPFAVASLLGVAMIQMGSSPAVLLTGAALFGLGCGAENSTMAYFVTRYFGVRSFSVVYGSKLPFLLLAAAPAPIVLGRIYDQTHSYAWGLVIVELILATAAIFFLVLEPYRYPLERGSDAGRLSEVPQNGVTLPA